MKVKVKLGKENEEVNNRNEYKTSFKIVQCTTHQLLVELFFCLLLSYHLFFNIVFSNKSIPIKSVFYKRTAVVIDYHHYFKNYIIIIISSSYNSIICREKMI